MASVSERIEMVEAESGWVDGVRVQSFCGAGRFRTDLESKEGRKEEETDSEEKRVAHQALNRGKEGTREIDLWARTMVAPQKMAKLSFAVPLDRSDEFDDSLESNQVGLIHHQPLDEGKEGE